MDNQTCRSCGATVGTDATTCPACGAKLRPPNDGQGVHAFLLLLSGSLLLAVGAVGLYLFWDREDLNALWFGMAAAIAALGVLTCLRGLVAAWRARRSRA